VLALVRLACSTVHDRDSKRQRRDGSTVSEFRESFMSYSRTNNKPSTVYAKEWMLDASSRSSAR